MFGVIFYYEHISHSICVVLPWRKHEWSGFIRLILGTVFKLINFINFNDTTISTNCQVLLIIYRSSILLPFLNITNLNRGYPISFNRYEIIYSFIHFTTQFSTSQITFKTINHCIETLYIEKITDVILQNFVHWLFCIYIYL